MSKHIAPKILVNGINSIPLRTTYTCPLCNTVAVQYIDKFYTSTDRKKYYQYSTSYLVKTECTSCSQNLLWFIDFSNRLEYIIYPEITFAIPPTDDMPNDVKEVYREAALICQKSPRAAAALLRVAMEPLLPHIGAKQNKLNEMIKELVSNEIITTRIQQAMDFVRLVGNDGAHPTSEILMDDSQEIVDHMFRLLNLIVQQHIKES